ncbi:hypothetical protein K2173_006010 [Erythroxylum novogranatense]|uniref:Calmodulin-lysine N-methyltransferase n=1 Tax=Erythroxylum novogranatense TaxID=1862640 RepID=A0AAV8TDG4_9ROSI|nr:hypothetical protein K2173_006010 [Erythroxylum novogranatense]
MEAKASSLRWGILRQAILGRCSPQNHDGHPTSSAMKSISRKASQGFNLIPSHPVDDKEDSNRKDSCTCYILPVPGAPKLFLTQRADNVADLSDFENSNRYNVDNTGLVCNWPSEEVMAYFCLSHADMFRTKRVIELGSGYGLAGLVIAATTEALEVVISDGNPQVVDYIQQNIDSNTGVFSRTKVKSMALHWEQDISRISDTFDVIIASDCTFFKEFHKGLACTLKLLLTDNGPSEAIFFSPKRGDSLDKFLETIQEYGFRYSVTENYDADVWRLHQGFMYGNEFWPTYDKDHCYPLLVRISL